MTYKRTAFFTLICALIVFPFLFVITPEASANYPKGSVIAGQYIEDKTDLEVRTLLDDAITVWQTGDDLIIKSEYEVFEIPRTSFTFDVEATLQEFKEQTKRKITSFFIKPKNVHLPLHVKINTSNEVVEQLRELEYIHADDTMKQVTNVASELDNGSSPLVYTDEDAIPFESISEVTMDANELTDATLKQSLINLDGHTIHAHDLFSVIQQTEFSEDSKNKNEDASFVASKLYFLFLETNFQIAERHIHQTLPAGMEPGFDAYINVKDLKDLVVVNPNDISFVFDVEEVDDAITIALTSADHRYVYNIEREEKTIEPRTIYRYSDELAFGEETIIQQGVPGKSVIVERFTDYENEDEPYIEFMSHDIYTLIPTIVLTSTIDEETAQEETVEEQVNELERTIESFEQELSEVKETATSNAEAGDMIASLQEQLSNIQNQQAEFMQLIVALQEQINQTDHPYDAIEQQLDAMEERLKVLEEHVDEFE